MFYQPHKKIVFFFFSFFLLILILVLFFLFSQEGYVIITIVPKPEEIFLETTFQVSPVRVENQSSLKGEFLEINLTKEVVNFPKASLEIDAYASGEVTIINNSNQNQTLIKTTRLLSPEKIVFRLANRIVVPAKGEVKVDVYADKAGKESEIGPTQFSLPGLSPSLQNLIYAKSDKKMTGGTKKIGIITASDIKEAEKLLAENIIQEAELEMRKKIEEELKEDILFWKPILLEKSLKIESNAKPNEEKGEFKTRGNLKINVLVLKKDEVLNLAKEKLKTIIPANKEIVSIEEKSLQYNLKNFSLKEKRADFELKLKGKMVIQINHPIFNLEKIKGLNEKAIKSYFEQHKEIESTEMKFYPFWIKKSPLKKELIKINILSKF